ncbi:MAG: TetR/AcrR family transcriptional regulator [Deltaproteobacteria bacterium]|nr:TetR/AcrR family transcriptional regulator [Deltaproteobacteria bacterium]MBW2445527.1 TetR/AcrR family transcriptional regulator [Deltaproteobacteria bacterium]
MRPPSPRRQPKQDRSREIVEAIQQAGLQILEQEGPAALTTNRIAEIAGVSIGSLYRYYPNKEAIVAAVYEARTQRDLEVFQNVERWSGALDQLPLRASVRSIVETAAERERQLLELDRDFYRDHNRQFILGFRVGKPLVDGIRRILEGKRDELRVQNLDHASFLLARGLGGILRTTLDERPEALSDPLFIDELVDLFLQYLVGTAPSA